MNPLELEERRLRMQDVYRGHAAPVVFVGFLSDASTMVTVDRSGKVYSILLGVGWRVCVGSNPRSPSTCP